jgi:hypothetical protein
MVRQAPNIPSMSHSMEAQLILVCIPNSKMHLPLLTDIDNALSISMISSDVVDVKAQCSLHTVDYTPALVEGPSHTWAVGPPQTVISITCTGGIPPNPPKTIVIEFDGADPSQGAKYSLTVPLDGSVVPTRMLFLIII